MSTLAVSTTQPKGTHIMAERKPESPAVVVVRTVKDMLDAIQEKAEQVQRHLSAGEMDAAWSKSKTIF